MAHFAGPFKQADGVTKAMILAAGRGERMGRLTATTPKPLLRVAGQTLIGRQLRSLAAAGIRDVVVNLAYRGEQLRQALGDGSRYGVAIQFSDEGPQALETAGGVIQALPLLGSEPFLLVSADVVHDFAFHDIANTAGDLGRLVLVRNPTHHPRGDFGLTAQGRLSLTPPRLTFAGLALLHPTLFAGLAPGVRPLREVLRPAIKKGALSGQYHAGLWMDVGTPARLKAAGALLKRLA